MAIKVNKRPDYHLADGTIATSVTQAIGILEKGGLAPKANQLGFDKINSGIYWKELAKIGTIAHYLILCHLKGEKPDTSQYIIDQKKAQYIPDLIDKAENSFLSYLEWEKNHKIETVLLETPLVSEQYRFGLTTDCVCHLDEQSWLTLIDYKTGTMRDKRTRILYPEPYYQVSGYKLGLAEHGYDIKDAIILGIPRTNDESFDEESIMDFDAGVEIFLECLSLHDKIKRYEKEKINDKSIEM